MYKNYVYGLNSN